MKLKTILQRRNVELTRLSETLPTPLSFGRIHEMDFDKYKHIARGIRIAINTINDGFTELRCPSCKLQFLVQRDFVEAAKDDKDAVGCPRCFKRLVFGHRYSLKEANET